MLDFSALHEFPCELLLNGVPIRSVRVRQIADSVDDFDVIVTDPILGAFPLHIEFEIDLHEADSSWRRVSLDELKGILKGKHLLPAEDLPKASEMAECRLFARVDDIQIPSWKCGRLSTLGARRHVSDTFSGSFTASESRTWFQVRRLWCRACRPPGFLYSEQAFGRVRSFPQR